MGLQMGCLHIPSEPGVLKGVMWLTACWILSSVTSLVSIHSQMQLCL